MNNVMNKKDTREIDAKLHVIDMVTRKSAETTTSIQYSKIFDQNDIKDKYLPKFNETSVIIEQTDSVSAILGSSDKPCVLNFANFFTPGGGFINGAMAQEEALCHESNLYNILCGLPNFYNKNKELGSNTGLHFNRAIYSPDVVFERRNDLKLANIITCAAPNATQALLSDVSEEENAKVLFERIDFILGIAAEMNEKTLILGAFGCGIFGQNAYTVGSIFKHLLTTRYAKIFELIVFAIPDDKNMNLFKSGFNNYPDLELI